MTLMELQMQVGNDGKAIFHSSDVDELGISQNQLVKIFEEDSPNSAILTAHIDDRALKDTILGDPNLLKNLGLQDEMIVDVEVFNGTIQIAEKVIIEFSTIDSDPREFFQENNVKNLRKFLDSYRFYQTSELYWPEQYSNLRISIIEPTDSHNTVYRVTTSCAITLKEQVQSMPFNAILLIDKSGSMNRKDVNLEGIEDTLKDLQNRLLEGGSLQNRYIELRKLFLRLKPTNTFKEKSVQDSYGNWKIVKEKIGASRLDSVIFATLLFFQLKISRGYGEKCAFVIYADDAKPVSFDGKVYIEASEFNAKICNELTKTIKNSTFMRYGNTNISSGLSFCKKIALDYKHKENSMNPLMVLLLTDGSPYPPHLDNDQNLLDTIYRLKESLTENQIPFVIYTIGIGEARNNKAATLLTRVGKAGNGEFHYVNSVKKLISFYQKLATNFAYNIYSETRFGD